MELCWLDLDNEDADCIILARDKFGTDKLHG